MTRTSVVPDRDGQRMADALLDATDVQRAIIEETLDSMDAGQIKESGRTFCPDGDSKLRGPAARYPEAVDLATCPWGTTGIMHTHVTEDELSEPEHSLPDMANVLFGDADASIVTGVHSADVLMAPDDPRPAKTVFEDAIGTSISHPGEVAKARKTVANPQRARNQIRRTLSPLFRRQRTGFREFQQRIGQAPAAAMTASEPITAANVIAAREGLDGRRTQTAAEACRHRVAETREGGKSLVEQTTSGVDIQQIVVGSVIGDVATSGFRWAVRRGL